MSARRAYFSIPLAVKTDRPLKKWDKYKKKILQFAGFFILKHLNKILNKQQTRF